MTTSAMHVQPQPSTRRLKVVVVAVAAESGGALSVLQEVAHSAATHSDIEWRFLVSRAQVPPAENLSTAAYPSVKRSWIHRILFDHFVQPWILRKERPDVLLSLQNVPVPHTKTPQVIYLHQALAFSEFRFDIRKEPKAWAYQAVTMRRILRGLRVPSHIVVQTHWMKDEVERRRPKGCGPVSIVEPTMRVVPPTFSPENVRRDFFYPASALSYKNHRVIAQAIEILDQRGVAPFTVILTMSRAEWARLKLGEPSSRIQFLGRIDRESVLLQMSRTTLLFPSRVETVGLPLLEAMAMNAPIIVADLPYAHEAVGRNYPVAYFSPNDPVELAALMERSLRSPLVPRGAGDASMTHPNELGNGWSRLVGLIRRAAGDGN